MSVNQQSHKEPAQAPPAPVTQQEPKKQEQKSTPAPATKQATGVQNATAPVNTTVPANQTKATANSTQAPKPPTPAPKKVVVEKEDPETEGMSSEEKDTYNMQKKLKAKKQQALEKAEEGTMGSAQSKKAQEKSKLVEAKH